MAENFSFFDPVEVAPGVWDREYFAQQFTDYFRRLVTTGVMKGESGELKVSTEGNSMITTLSTGVAYVVGRSYENTSPLTHTHDTEVLGKNRIDRIVVRLDLRTESRFVKSFIKKGVPTTVPVAPALQRDQFIYEISLAQVKIIGGQTYINANDVIDERGKTDICPWAGSKILPNFDQAGLEEHIHDYKEHIPYAVTTGGTNEVYDISLDGVTDLYEGLAVSIKMHKQSGVPVFLRINGLNTKLIVKPNGQNPSALKKDGIYTLRYNGNSFILQGEGGSGTAIVGDVLTGKTFTNDEGEFTGTMPNRGAVYITPTESLQYIPAGYHNGAGYVRGAQLYKKVVVDKTVSIPYNAARVTIPIYVGFPPREWAVEINNLGFNSNYNLSGVIGIVFGGTYVGDTLRLDYGGNAPTVSKQLYCWVHQGYNTYVSGNYLYFDLEFITAEEGFKGLYPPVAQTRDLKFTIWG
ncbi:hypothetical protein P9D39_24380 [Heyndrickxia oleronia]|uniref:Uncharacterized protein n=1 Tax=Heyndrickxia oleronia TaxID=38875 RepID=A0A8E2LHE5_9BACI|nr:hypothetical protein [Heyndrickxia oleronia]MEC1377367.1 hypothetical protein [Heyndrickxia oleronia]OOP70164.1 hypothetical protein BWZ43_01065 [Heyndrickxia oleronia]QQZ06006.1 hypothetical protein I5818_06005 [Heyndrickxia oleronia]